MTKGRITISHPVSISDPDGWIRIETRFDDKIVQADIDLGQFTKLITGTAMMPCDITTYEKKVTKPKNKFM